MRRTSHLRARPGRARPGARACCKLGPRPGQQRTNGSRDEAEPRPGVLHHPDGGGGAGRVPPRRAARRPRPSRSATRCTGSRPRPVTAPHALPGFARSTVDGYAVRAADTYGASEGLPGYLDRDRRGTDGHRAGRDASRPGSAVSHADRRRAAAGRGRGGDGRVHRRGDARHDRGDPPGRARARAGARRRGRRAGRRSSRTGAPLRASGPRACSPRRGSRACAVHARPRVTIFSTGDEVVPPGHRRRSARVRCATRPPSALAALVADAGGEPVLGGIVPDDPGRPGVGAARGAGSQRPHRGLGRLLGRRPRRDRDRRRRARRAGHLVPRPGGQAGQADAAGRVRRRPGHRAAGQPALGAGGVPAARDAAGPPGRRLHGAAAGAVDAGPAVARPRLRHRPARRRPGRRSATGSPTPLFGLSALLSVLTAADGYIVIPEEATGLDAGTEVDVTLYRSDGPGDSPFIRDVPAARALAAWQAARDAAGCPARLPAVAVPVAEAAGRVTAAPVWATRSSPPFDAAGMDGIAVRAADTLGASETTPCAGARRLRRGRHRRPDARRPGRGRDARARALRHRRPGRAARGRPALPARPLDRRGRQRRRAAAARKATGCVPPTWPPAPRPARSSLRSGDDPLVA